MRRLVTTARNTVVGSAASAPKLPPVHNLDAVVGCVWRRIV